MKLSFYFFLLSEARQHVLNTTASRIFGKREDDSCLCGLLTPKCPAENSLRKADFCPSVFAKYNCSSTAQEKRQPFKHADPSYLIFKYILRKLVKHELLA